MEKICPVCNKLESIKLKCKNCEAYMDEDGRAQEIMLDDYTANMPINDSANYCIHVFRCTCCGYSELKMVGKIIV